MLLLDVAPFHEEDYEGAGPGKVAWDQADVRDEAALDRLLKGTDVVIHAAAALPLLFFVPLWSLWQLLNGEWGRYGWIAGAAAATIGATLGELVRSRAEAGASVAASTIASIPSALGMVFVDFGIVVWALLLRRRGAFRDADAVEALPAYVASISPNAYVVDDGTTHHLVPNPKSQDPV